MQMKYASFTINITMLHNVLRKGKQFKKKINKGENTSFQRIDTIFKAKSVVTVKNRKITPAEECYLMWERL